MSKIAVSAMKVVSPRPDRSSRRREVPTQRRERARQQPRHVHLRDAQLPPDLALGQLAEETELQDPPLTLRQRRQQRAHRFTLLDEVELGLDLAERGSEPRAVA